MDEKSLVGEKRASEPRQRLAKLLLWRRFRRWVPPDGSEEERDREIKELAKQQPEIFKKDFVIRKQTGVKVKAARRSPLSWLFAHKHHEGLFVSMELFEAVFAAYPDAVHSEDSRGDTVLLDLVSYYDGYRFGRGNDNTNEKYMEWLGLLQSLIQKAPSVLVARPGCLESPLTKAVGKECPQHVIQFMIDNHPGDAFREETANRGTLLASVMARRNCYSFNFIKYIYNKHPDAVEVTIIVPGF